LIAAILGWTKLPQWALELIVILFVAGGIWFWQHERYEAGITAQVTTDAAASAKVKREADAKTATLQLRATTAELAYEQEHQTNLQFQHDHLLSDVRLCVAAAPSGSHVPASGAVKPGAATAGAAPASVPAMPAGNTSGAAVDIGPMLSSFANSCDEVSAVLREYQQR